MSGSSTQTKNTSSQTSPWAPQAGALTTAFDAAGGALKQAKTATAPTDFVSQFTPDQLSTFKSMLGYANSNNIPGVTGNTATTNQNLGTNATAAGLYGLAGYDPSAANNPQSLIDAAKNYASGQNIDGQVNDALLNARQTARDVTLPGIDQAAANSGNTDSSRTGIAQGMVERGLAEQASNLGATLRNQAFGTGLQLAANNANANNSSKLGALSALISGGNAAANTGVNAGTSSINDQGNLYSLASNAGAGEREAGQAALDNQLQQYQSRVSSPYDALRQYMGIVGSGNWGSSTTGTETTKATPSAWSVLGGLLGGAGNIAGMAGGLGWKPFA